MKNERTTKWKVANVQHYNSSNDTVINTYLHNLTKQVSEKEKKYGECCAHKREIVHIERGESALYTKHILQC